MKYRTFIIFLFLSTSFFLYIYPAADVVDQPTYQYHLDVSSVRHNPDSWKVGISKKTSGRAPAQNCSFIANFATRTCENQENLSTVLDVPPVLHDMAFGDGASDSFIWNIPNFGQLKLASDGTTFFGHDAKEVPILRDRLTISTHSKLFLETLRVASLKTQSKEAVISGTVVADQLCADHDIENYGSVRTKHLQGDGTFFNNARLELDGTKANPARLDIMKFYNQSGFAGVHPVTQASFLRITTHTKELHNKEDATIDASDDFIFEERRSSGVHSLFHNKGVLKTKNCALRGDTINEGSIQANSIRADRIDNKEFGHVVSAQNLYIEHELANEGEIEVKHYISLCEGKNKGTIHGSPYGPRGSLHRLSGLALNIRSIMENHGKICLHKLEGAGTCENHKELQFNAADSSNVEIAQLINYAQIDAQQLHLRRYGHMQRNPLLINKQGASINTQKTIIDKATVDNQGNFCTDGDTEFYSAQVANVGDMLFRSGGLQCVNTPLSNDGNMLMERMKFVLRFGQHERQKVTNNGTLELAESIMHFGELINNKDIVAHSGTYTIDRFKNKLLQLCGPRWTVTDDPAMHGQAKFILPHPPQANPITDDRLGVIRSENNMIYDLPIMPIKIESQKNVSCWMRRMRDIHQLKHISTIGNVMAWCKSSSIGPNEHLSFSNIGGLLKLILDAPLTVYGSLTAPQLELQVPGICTVGKSNAQLGTIAATHGPLTIRASGIDGSYGKFYGKGKTSLEATNGNVKIGEYTRGIDQGIKQQFEYNLKNSPYNKRKGLFKSWIYGGDNPIISNYLANFDHSLYTRNGAYVASNDHLVLGATDNITVNYGTVRSQSGIYMTARNTITNCAGKISSQGPIALHAQTYNHSRSGWQGKASWVWEPNTRQATQYPGSCRATLESLESITCDVKKMHNYAGTIRATHGVTLNGGVPSPATGYREEAMALFHHWVNADCDFCSYPSITESCALQSAGDIHINMGELVITGNMHAKKIALHGGTGLFANDERTRNTQHATGPIIADVTRYIQQEAQQPGIYKLGARGAVETEFPLGVPSAPQEEDRLLLENPHYAAPLIWKNLFNPLSSINIDLHLQQLLSELAGKVYAGNAKGNALSRVLWANAKKWRQEHNKDHLTHKELQHAPKSMLLSQVVRNGLTEQQHTLLCIAPQDINPYQSPGDIVAEDEFVCETESNQTHLNTRIITHGAGGITLNSRTGNVTLETQKYTTEHHSRDGSIVKEHAYPQQQLIAQGGSVRVHADNTLTRVGTVIAAADTAEESARTGSVIKQPLVLKTTITEKEEDGGFFSSSETVTTTESHAIMPSETTAGVRIQTHSESAIRAVAPQETAGEEIVYSSPDTQIEGIIVANRTTTQSTTTSAFTETKRSSMEETPCALPSSLQAPVVRFEGERARVNATIQAQDIYDDTVEGVQFVAKVVEMLRSGQVETSSPFIEMDAGYRAGRETMIQPQLMAERIVRNRPDGQMLFESAIIDKDRTEIIGKFVETTYQLKEWQENWCHVSQVFSDEVLVLAALAIAIATQGAGVELCAPLLNSVTAATGMQLSAAGIAAVNAACTTICSAGATSFLKTGDPLQAVQQLGSREFVKSIAFSMASAGICSQLDTMLPINMGAGAKPLFDHAAEHAVRSSVDALLHVAVEGVPVDKALGDACKQIPLRAAASYASNQICSSFMDDIGRKAAHTLLGGAAGFAEDGSTKGFTSGAVGAFTAETVGDIVFSDSRAISDAALARLREKNKPYSVENIQLAVAQEVEKKVKLVRLVSGALATAVGQKTAIAAGAARNTLENDLAIRARLYALHEMRPLLQAASQAVSHLTVHQEAVAQQQPQARAARQQERRTSARASQSNEQGDSDSVSDMAHELVLQSIHNSQSETHKYDDIILECAHEWQPQPSTPREHGPRSLLDRIVHPEVPRLVEKSSEIIQDAFVHALNQTIDTCAWFPTPVGMACFAVGTGRDIQQGHTTFQRFLTDMALAYGVFKGIKLTGKGAEALYSKIKGMVNEKLMPNHQRYLSEGWVPFVENPRAWKWTEAKVSNALMLDNIEFIPLGMLFSRNAKAPYFVESHGSASYVCVTDKMIAYCPKALSQKNRAILEKNGKVNLDASQLARLLIALGEYKKGHPIVLLGCSTGKRKNGFAQQLSNRLKSPVLAFTEDVYTTHSFFGYEIKSRSQTMKKGILKTFYPQAERELGPDTAKVITAAALSALSLSGFNPTEEDVLRPIDNDPYYVSPEEMARVRNLPHDDSDNDPCRDPFYVYSHFNESMLS